MLVLLWPYMPSLIEQVREDLKNKTHHAAQAAEEQLATPPKTLSGTSKPVPSKTPYNHTPSSEDEERERLQSALDYETGRIALEKTDEISEGESGGTSYDRNFSGSGYVSQAAEDMQRIVSQLAEESAAIRYEEELSEELQDESNRISYGTILAKKNEDTREKITP